MNFSYSPMLDRLFFLSAFAKHLARVHVMEVLPCYSLSAFNLNVDVSDARNSDAPALPRKKDIIIGHQAFMRSIARWHSRCIKELRK